MAYSGKKHIDIQTDKNVHVSEGGGETEVQRKSNKISRRLNPVCQWYLYAIIISGLTLKIKCLIVFGGI